MFQPATEPRRGRVRPPPVKKSRLSLHWARPVSCVEPGATIPMPLMVRWAEIQHKKAIPLRTLYRFEADALSIPSNGGTLCCPNPPLPGLELNPVLVQYMYSTNHVMTKQRYNELNGPEEGSKLTPDEITLGWHWCAEFDGLLVGPEMGELAHCSCHDKTHPVYKTIHICGACGCMVDKLGCGCNPVEIQDF